MSRMRAFQVTAAKGPFELVERNIPEPPLRLRDLPLTRERVMAALLTV
jgi:hypothetical protein